MEGTDAETQVLSEARHRAPSQRRWPTFHAKQLVVPLKPCLFWPLYLRPGCFLYLGCFRSLIGLKKGSSSIVLGAKPPPHGSPLLRVPAASPTVRWSAPITPCHQQPVCWDLSPLPDSKDPEDSTVQPRGWHTAGGLETSRNDRLSPSCPVPATTSMFGAPRAHGNGSLVHFGPLQCMCGTSVRVTQSPWTWKKGPLRFLKICLLLMFKEYIFQLSERFWRARLCGLFQGRWAGPLCIPAAGGCQASLSVAPWE